MNGNERLWWNQRADGYVYLTNVSAPIPEGFERFSTTTPSEMDRIYAKIDKQDKATYARMTEETYNRRKGFLDENLSNLRMRLANSSNEMEKDVLRVWIEAFNRRQTKLQTCTVYGVSAMQTTEANPKARGDNPVTFVPSVLVN